jgi:hypothetical protein
MQYYFLIINAAILRQSGSFSKWSMGREDICMRVYAFSP